MEMEIRAEEGEAKLLETAEDVVENTWLS